MNGLRFGKKKEGEEVNKILADAQSDHDKLVNMAKAVMRTKEYKELNEQQSNNLDKAPVLTIRSLLSLAEEELNPEMFAFQAIKILERYRVIQKLIDGIESMDGK